MMDISAVLLICRIVPDVCRHAKDVLSIEHRKSLLIDLLIQLKQRNARLTVNPKGRYIRDFILLWVHDNLEVGNKTAVVDLVSYLAR